MTIVASSTAISMFRRQLASCLSLDWIGLARTDCQNNDEQIKSGIHYVTSHVLNKSPGDNEAMAFSYDYHYDIEFTMIAGHEPNHRNRIHQSVKIKVKSLLIQSKNQKQSKQTKNFNESIKPSNEKKKHVQLTGQPGKQIQQSYAVWIPNHQIIELPFWAWTFIFSPFIQSLIKCIIGLTLNYLSKSAFGTFKHIIQILRAFEHNIFFIFILFNIEKKFKWRKKITKLNGAQAYRIEIWNFSLHQSALWVARCEYVCISFVFWSERFLFLSFCFCTGDLICYLDEEGKLVKSESKTWLMIDKCRYWRWKGKRKDETISISHHSLTASC